LRFFPGGFADEKYVAWERDYKIAASKAWRSSLARPQLEKALHRQQYGDISATALRIESRTNLLFSFEKMALRDATRTPAGSERFARGLYTYLYGNGTAEQRFTEWVEMLSSLPARRRRVLTWPVATVFGFIAQPARHIVLKPNVTRNAASRYGFDLRYDSSPSWTTYRRLLAFAHLVRSDLRDLEPRDLIDIQSFLWVQGSEEYGGRTFRAAYTTALT